MQETKKLERKKVKYICALLSIYPLFSLFSLDLARSSRLAFVYSYYIYFSSRQERGAIKLTLLSFRDTGYYYTYYTQGNILLACCIGTKTL